MLQKGYYQEKLHLCNKRNVKNATKCDAEEKNMINIKERDDREVPKILVIGAGGGGNNAVNRMIRAGVKGVSFAAVNTDKFVLDKSEAEKRIQIGGKLLKGYGAGADPELGESAAKESEEELKALVEECNMVIVTCGMGGGTGTGAVPVIARVCKELGILILGVVTLPFSFEGDARMAVAKQGVEKLKEWVDTLIVIPNDKLLGLTDKPLMLEAAFETADSVLKNTIESISNIVYNDGTVNIDFNDLKTTLIGKGVGHLGVGIVGSEGTALEAAKQAVNSPLLDTSIEGAEVLLVNTYGRVDIHSISEAINYLKDLAGAGTRVIWGTVSAEDIGEDKIMVMLLATGMKEKTKPKPAVKLDKIDRREIARINIKPSGSGGELKIPSFLKTYADAK